MRIERCLSRGAQISSSPFGSSSPQSKQQQLHFELLISELQPAIEAIKRLLSEPQSAIEAPPFLNRNPQTKQSFPEYNQKQVLFQIQSPSFNCWREPSRYISGLAATAVLIHGNS
ncbi:hypothetical protein VPH35_119362 [Triticum aestivum]